MLANRNRSSSSRATFSLVARRSRGPGTSSTIHASSSSPSILAIIFPILALMGAFVIWESVQLGHPPQSELNEPVASSRVAVERLRLPTSYYHSKNLRITSDYDRPEKENTSVDSKQKHDDPVNKEYTPVQVDESVKEEEDAAAPVGVSAAAAAAVVTTTTHAVRTETDAGVKGLDDPILYKTVDIQGDSSTATVMGMATGYGIGVYKKFVGSLRKSGFLGHIIIGVSPDVSREILDYFAYRNVTPKLLQWVPCTYQTTDEEDKHDIFKKTTCSHPYPDIKIRWSRFPLQRDWLEDCKTCTGPVLIMDVGDTYFQTDPFGPRSPPITGLQVFQEHPSQTTEHWLIKPFTLKCKGVAFNKPMLCSGSTIGTREAILKYLEVIHAEMKVWISTPTCRFNLNGDDQTIHNYLFYTGQLPFAHSIPNRMGIVNTVGVHGANTLAAKRQRLNTTEGLSPGEAAQRPYPGANEKTWIGVEEFNVTDSEGFFTQFDGITRSSVIHQYDRYGLAFLDWLDKKGFMKDPMPKTE